MDDKAKVKVGVPAVSKFVKPRKYFEINHGPVTPDHDFPIGQRFLIIPSGKKLFSFNKYFKDIYNSIFKRIKLKTNTKDYSTINFKLEN